MNDWPTKNGYLVEFTRWQPAEEAHPTSRHFLVRPGIGGRRMHVQNHVYMVTHHRKGGAALARRSNRSLIALIWIALNAFLGGFVPINYKVS